MVPTAQGWRTPSGPALTRIPSTKATLLRVVPSFRLLELRLRVSDRDFAAFAIGGAAMPSLAHPSGNLGVCIGGPALHLEPGIVRSGLRVELCHGLGSPTRALLRREPVRIAQGVDGRYDLFERCERHRSVLESDSAHGSDDASEAAASRA